MSQLNKIQITQKTETFHDGTKPCHFCSSAAALYTCPRCGISYCSAICYKHKKHMSCSEIFFKNCFQEEMLHKNSDSQEKQDLIEIIKRVEEETPYVDFTESLSLEERLIGIDMEKLDETSSEELWQRLTTEERMEFQTLLNCGKIETGDNLLPSIWKPFWLEHQNDLILPVDSKHFSVNGALPSSLEKVAHGSLQQAVHKSSDCVGFNLLNVLYPFVCFQRIHNGCGFTDFYDDFCYFLILSSSCLRDNKVFSTTNNALIEAMGNAVSASNEVQISMPNLFFIECLWDMHHIFKGPKKDLPHGYVKKILADLKHLFQRQRKSLKRTQSTTSLSDDARKKKRSHCFQIIKKMEFFEAWIDKHYAMIPIIAQQISNLYEEKKFELNSHSTVNDAVDKNIEYLRKNIETVELTNKPLIKEVDCDGQYLTS